MLEHRYFIVQDQATKDHMVLLMDKGFEIVSSTPTPTGVHYFLARGIRCGKCGAASSTGATCCTNCDAEFE